ncbi:MAG: PilN domain-containing protein [Patescibacteria group bacterium]
MAINLIPPELKRQNKTKRIVGSFCGGVVVLAFLIGLGALSLYGFNNTKKAQVKRIEEETSETEKRIIALSDVEKAINDLNAKLDKVDAVNKKKVYWSTIMAQLAYSTPKQLVIESVSFTGEQQAVSITGKAESRQEIAKFKDKLENSDYFKSVRFTTSSYSEQGGNYTFSLTAQLEKVQ